MKLINNLEGERLILSHSNTEIRAEFPRKCLRKEKFKKFLIDEARQGRKRDDSTLEEVLI